MERVIKFRGNRVDNKMWVFGYYFIDLENKHPYIMLSERDKTIADWMLKSVLVYPETVGQFTGLHDKNGKEIYEGDVVVFEGTIYVCKWNISRCEFAWYLKDMASYLYPIGDVRIGVEVVGNIYEHSNLLQSK